MSFSLHQESKGTGFEVVARVAEESETFIQPITLGDQYNDWFWTEDCIFFPAAIGPHLVPENPICVGTSRKFISCGQMTHGVIFDESGFYSHFGFLTFSPMNTITIEGPNVSFNGGETLLEGAYASVFDGNSHNYYHWLIEGMTSLFILREAGITAPALFLRGEHVTSWHKEYLDLLGENNCIFIRSMDHETIAVDKLYWTKNRYLDTLSSSVLRRLSTFLKDKISGPLHFSKRIYIKRRREQVRCIANSAEVELALEAFGFASIFLEDFSVRDQIAMFSEADLVVGPHGAALSNVIFMRSDAILCEILPGGQEVRNIFYTLACKTNVKYAFVRGASSNPSNPYYSSIVVPVDDLKMMIAAVISQVSPAILVQKSGSIKMDATSYSSVPAIHRSGYPHRDEMTTSLEIAFNRALDGKSCLRSHVLSMSGMSGWKYRHFINNLVRMTSNARYLEVGSWSGSTACAAIDQNVVKALCIDNWSLFGGPKEEFFANTTKSRSETVDFDFIESDFRKVDIQSIGLYNIYLFDGPREEIDQYDAIALYGSALENEFVYIVDDWNWPFVRKGTFDAIEANGYLIDYHIEVRTTLNDEHTTEYTIRDGSEWHNGYFIGKLRRKPPA